MADEKLTRNPLASPEDHLYREPAAESPRQPRRARGNRDVVLATFSLYPEDIDHLNGLLAAIKDNGQRGANKSRIVRQALARFRAKDFKQPS